MEPTLEGAMALARSATGPLSPHLPAFITSLIDQRYAVTGVRAKAWRATAFDAWLSGQGVGLADVRDAHVDAFARRSYQPRSDCKALPHRDEPSAIRQLLRYLRGRGLCATSPTATTPVDELVTNFEQFLLRDRGLAPTTICSYRTIARDFLIHRFDDQPIKLDALGVADVIGYVQREAKRMRPRTLKQAVTALRAFLRYAVYRGDVVSSLVGVVPTVAVWTTTPPLPRAISADLARRAIESCDQNFAVGRRDRAVLLLLARLGLRSGEVVALMFDDIDWSAGHLRVRGKNCHECLLRLPDDVGTAIAAYLQDGRPTSTDRRLFLRARAPLRGLMQGSDGIGSIVRNALERTGEDAPRRGAHQFRHALAVRMLKDGASLPEIGELLRHRSPMSTAIYAKVDLVALRALALPWPGAAS